MKPLNIWLVRHGQSTWNAEGRIQGWADPPLSELGCWQAERVAQKLLNDDLDAIYSSPQQRAIATARAIADVTGVDIVVDTRLREHGMGIATGMVWSYAAIVERWPHLKQVLDRGEAIHPHIPDAEPIGTFLDRVTEAFDAIREQYPAGNVVVVAHGGVFRNYVSSLIGAERTSAGLHFSNASLSLVSFVENSWVDIKYLNDTCHLRESLPAKASV